MWLSESGGLSSRTYLVHNGGCQHQDICSVVGLSVLIHQDLPLERLGVEVEDLFLHCSVQGASPCSTMSSFSINIPSSLIAPTSRQLQLSPGAGWTYWSSESVNCEAEKGVSTSDHWYHFNITFPTWFRLCYNTTWAHLWILRNEWLLTVAPLIVHKKSCSCLLKRVLTKWTGRLPDDGSWWPGRGGAGVGPEVPEASSSTWLSELPCWICLTRT